MQDNKVIWLEGMFLQPQHFQQQERYYENLLHAKINMMEKNLWGFSEIQIDTQLLTLGKLTVATAKGFFQDGTQIDIPIRDPIPTPFQIPEGMDNTILYLGIPIKQQSAEAGDTETKSLYRYQVSTMEVKDNTAGNDQIAEIQIGSLCCKILSEQDDRSSFHCLQLTKILESRSNYTITIDKNFLPNCIEVRADKQLYQIITEIYGLLNHRSEILAARLIEQYAGTAEIVDFMLLQLVNRYASMFHYLERKASLHPEFLFYVLIQLMGEIATFTSDNRRAIEVPAYQHTNLYDTFQPVMRELRNALSKVLEQNATAIPLQSKKHGLWIGQFPEKELISSCSFILAVYADLPIDTLRNSFSSYIKIAPVEQIQTLVSRQLPGIELQPIAIAPRQIPYHANFLYFTVNVQHELWGLLDKSAGVAFHVSNNFPGLKLELWAIKG